MIQSLPRELVLAIVSLAVTDPSPVANPPAVVLTELSRTCTALRDLVHRNDAVWRLACKVRWTGRRKPTLTLPAKDDDGDDATALATATVPASESATASTPTSHHPAPPPPNKLSAAAADASLDDNDDDDDDDDDPGFCWHPAVDFGALDAKTADALPAAGCQAVLAARGILARSDTVDASADDAMDDADDAGSDFVDTARHPQDQQHQQQRRRRRRLLARLVATTPAHAPKGQSQYRWGSAWKASYMVAERDARRKAITRAELCAAAWSFRYRTAVVLAGGGGGGSSGLAGAAAAEAAAVRCACPPASYSSCASAFYYASSSPSLSSSSSSSASSRSFSSSAPRNYYFRCPAQPAQRPQQLSSAPPPPSAGVDGNNVCRFLPTGAFEWPGNGSRGRWGFSLGFVVVDGAVMFRVERTERWGFRLVDLRMAVVIDEMVE